MSPRPPFGLTRRFERMQPLDVFAENVRRLRLERQLTQEGLAERAGLNTTDIRRIETHRRDPGVKVVAKIAAGLGVHTSALFDGADAPSDFR